MILTWWKHADSTRRALLFVGLGLAGLLVASGVALRVQAGRTSRSVVQKSMGLDLEEKYEGRGLRAPQVSALDPAFMPDKLVRRGTLSLEVEDMAAFDARIRMLAGRDGYLSQWHGSLESSGQRRVQLTWRVPNARFEASLAAFKGLGRVLKEEVSTEDVGRAYADLEARRLNKRAAAARIRELIQNRAGKLSEVLEAEQSLTQVTQELEQMEAQKRVMDSEIAFATLQAVVQTPLPVAPEASRSVWIPLRRAFRRGMDTLIDTMVAVVELSVVFLPWLMLPGLGLWIWMAKRRKRQRLAKSTA